MPRNDRIPEGVRKEINKIGPGKYLDPSTGRTYIDSADMDDYFDEMIDGVAEADQKRIDELEARRKLPRPPINVQRQADEHVRRHAERMLQKVEDSADHGWRKRAEGRLALLNARATLRELDEEEKQELADLKQALAPAADGTETEQENDDGIEGTAGGD